MALLTDWPEAAARETLAEYGLVLEHIEPVAGGSVNSNFSIVAAGGRRLFARIYEEQDAAGAQREVALLAELSVAGVPTPAPLARAAGGALASFAGKPLAIFPWVEGRMRCQAAVRASDCRRLGKALAAMHRAPVGDLPEGRFGIDPLEQRLDRIEREAPGELARAAGEIRLRLRTYSERRDPDLPAGLVHGDLFRDNVLWNESEIAALIDFESASRGAYVYDLAVCVHAWCFSDRFEPELASALVSGYHASRRLEPREIDAFRVEAALGALRFAVTRITDYSMRAAPGAPPLRDFRRFMARLSALEAGALDPALAGLR
jgi:homoserine kinase type II